MTSCDTNFLFYLSNRDCPEHHIARESINEYVESEKFILCELVLVELYVLLRNPKLLNHPLNASDAVNLVQGFRSNPYWRIIDYPGNLMNDIWKRAASPNFARHEIYDAKLAFTLQHHGVTTFLTRNTKHFKGYGLTLINPFD